MASSEIKPILEIFNNLLFFCTLSEYQPKWDASLEDVYGCHQSERTGHLIVLSSTYTGDASPTEGFSVCEARALVRLGTLLHECTHAYLNRFACRTCLRYGVNVKHSGGHGRAFQRLAKALENVSESVLGVRLSVSDDGNFVGSWSEVSYLPSHHDMVEWNWFARQ